MAVNPIDGTLAAKSLTGSRGADLIYGAAPALVAAGAPALVPVASGLGTAVFATAAPGDAGRLFVVEKADAITSLDLASGTITAVLDITPEVNRAGEQGLLGLAFHPEFHLNGRLFVFFSNLAGDTVLREYTMDPADPGRVLPGSARDLLTVPQPEFQNHKAGWIGFGPDGMLYAATGDGGSGGDPFGTGQNPNDLLGSILRVDVNGPDAFPADPTRNYAIPADNPFAGGGGAPEVWAYGLRNPYRDGFDRGTGVLWIGDVGQGRQEEIDLGAPGANYGWALYEGDLTYPGGLPAATLPAGITGPAFAYGREEGDRTVIGGYVHRGPDSALHGQYVFGDYVTGRLWTLADGDGDGVLEAAERPVLDDTTLGGFRLASFAEDSEGTLYALGLDGSLFRVAPGTPTGTPDGGDTIVAGGGDDRAFAGAGNDLANGGTGNDLLAGMEGDDRLVGGVGADTLAGGAGLDLLRSGAGNDLLMGGAGRDNLIGDAGDDLLVGGGAGDRLTGGDGADRFRWTGILDSPGGVEADRVLDFDATEGDVLDVSALAAGVFTMIGAAAFAATGAQLRTVANAAGTRVELSLDGGPADLVFVVVGVAGLSAADFLL